jgi:hypothetical protein
VADQLSKSSKELLGKLPADFNPGRPRPYVEHDGYLVMFVPDSDLDGLKSFHLVIKRTYHIAPDQRLERTTWQRQICQGDEYFDGAGPFESSLRTETELGPPKAATDIIVNATCYAPGGEATHCYPEVRVGKHLKRLIVIGNRIATIRAGKDPEFTPAQKFSALPVRYEYAYGGVDQQHSMAPLMCPTNPLGMGYLVAGLDADPPRDRWTVMPNIEDPENLIQPGSLLVPSVQDAKVREPAGLGWVPRHWEPRALLAGMPAGAKPLWQKLFGDKDKEGKHFKELQAGFWNGAPRGLQVPLLEGHEKISLKHLHRTREEFALVLPMDQPRLRVGINDTELQKVAVKLNTVQIEVEKGEVYLSWRGTLPAPNGLKSLEDLTRVLLEVDGQLVLPAPLVGTGFPIDLLTGAFPGPDLLELKGLPKPGG